MATRVKTVIDAQARVAGSKQITRLRKEMDGLSRSADKSAAALARQERAAMKSNKGMGGQIGMLKGGISSMNAYAAAALAAVYAVDRFASRAIDYSNVMQNLDYDTTALARSVDNMATEFEVAGAAARIQSSSLKLSQQEMNQLFEMTAKVADKNKKDLVPTLEAVSKAINTGSGDRLRSIGLQIDANKAIDEYAKSVGVSTTQLSLSTKQQIVYNELTKAMTAEVDKLGETADGAAFTFVRLKNQAVDWGDKTLAYMNELPQKFIEFADEVERLSEDVFRGLGFTAKEAEEATDKLGEAMDGLMRVTVAFATLGTSELIPLLSKWEQLMVRIGVAEQRVMRGQTEGGFSGTIKHYGKLLEQAQREKRATDGLRHFSQGWTHLRKGINQATTGMVTFFEEAERNSRKHRGSLKKQVELWQKLNLAADVEQAYAQQNFNRGQLATTSVIDVGFDDAETAIAEAVEFERAKADAIFNERMRAAEMARAEGIDPIDAINREEQAQLAHLEFLREHAESRSEILSVENAMEETAHQARLARIAEEEAAQQRRYQNVASMIQFGDQVAMESMALGNAIIDAEIQGSRRAFQAKKALQVSEHTLKAIFHGAQAISSAAFFDLRGAALHTLAAGKHGFAAKAAASVSFNGGGSAGLGGGVGSVGFSGASSQRSQGDSFSGGNVPSSIRGPAGNEPAANQKPSDASSNVTINVDALAVNEDTGKIIYDAFKKHQFARGSNA